MRIRDSLWNFIERHHALDGALEKHKGEFVSDWNGTHPFVERFLAGASIFRPPKDAAETLAKYLYFDRDPIIIDTIRRLHEKHDSLRPSPEGVIAGTGSSSFLAAFALWLTQQGYREILYVPPLYYTFHYFLRLLSHSLRPVSGRQLFEPGASLNLPPKRSVLLLCDPIWFAGRRLTEEQMQRIARWQKRTGSIVFIDGSFQYTQWDDTRRERSAMLDSNLTFRLIAPTKALAIPAFRFAYLLLPPDHHRKFLFLYESMVGSASHGDVAFARQALSVLATEQCNRPLTTFFRQAYEELLEKKLIRPGLRPDCGYFAFAVPTQRLPRRIAMTEDYFELRRHPDHVRVNLMIAARVLAKSRSARLNAKASRRKKP